ncbi:pulmonary surfactant-associated protein B [Pseudophryne corroboree]|uniref:pulmonary surfactant-associated protein B n=1 Tax=Pseudophryne corroboree TaxID=495146 RepID=UPI0030820A2C
MERTRLSLLCLLCVIAAASGKVLMKNTCAQGPEFWCQDLVTATQCGAVDHCEQNVWKEGEETLCDQCKQIVAVMLNMVKSSSIQTSIKKFLHNQCTHIPVSALIDQCFQLVEEYEGVLISILENQINPTSICSKITLCPSEPSTDWSPDMPGSAILESILPLIHDSIQTIHAKATQNLKEDWPIPKPMCWMCKSFMSKFEAAIPKGAIAKGASALCLALPGAIAGVCQCLVEKYTIIIIDTVVGKLGPKLVCGLLFLCVTEDNCVSGIIPDLESEGTCDMCLTITSTVKPTRGANMTQEEINAILSRVCTDSLEWKECHVFLQEHQTQLSELLLKPWDNKMTCQAVGACPAPSKTTPEDSGCTTGPTYWCQSLDTARECKAIGHCLAHVWH